MSHDSLSASFIEELIFWSEDAIPAENVNGEDGSGNDGELDEASVGVGGISTACDAKGKGKAAETRQSMYVLLFEDMINTVLKQESFLFSQDELDILESYSSISYNARYLLVRLLLRRSNRWFRLDKLKYISELGEAGIQNAIIELCTFTKSKPGEQNDKQPPLPIRSPASTQLRPNISEIIDLTLDDDDEVDMTNLTAGPSTTPLHTACKTTPTTQCSPEHDTSQEYTEESFIFAQDESNATLPELMECLTVDELKSIARTMKIAKAPTTRVALVDLLIATASSQSTLHGFVDSNTSIKKHAAKDRLQGQFKQTTLSFSPRNSGQGSSVQVGTLRQLAMKILKKCVRVNLSLRALARRLHIVFFRCTTHPPDILTPSLLARCRKRNYSAYAFKRTPTIFPSREALVAYEDALRMEAAIDTILDEGGYSAGRGWGNVDAEARAEAEAILDAWVKSRTDGATPLASFTPRWRTPANERERPDETSDKENTPANSQAHEVVVEVLPVVTGPLKETNAVQSARRVVAVFERVYPRWQELVREKGNLEGRDRGLERFDEGYILTRVVYKGAAAFGILKDFRREAGLLEELLSQRRWRRGKRGEWYDRWALILMHHTTRALKQRGVLIDEEDEEDTKARCTAEERRILQKATEIVVRGLHDDDTHVIERQALERRLTRLEKRLDVPAEQRHKCAGRLRKAQEVVVVGKRIREKAQVMAPKQAVGAANGANGDVPVSVQLQGPDAVKEYKALLKKWRLDEPEDKWVGKSAWEGLNGEKVTVEELALEHYQDQGFKGFHSEGRVVFSIFGLLFWDILFARVPGAFETPFQSAPLDIATDCFYFTRRDLIDARLNEIREGKAPEILAQVDDTHREDATQCVGVRWKDFEKQDLVEIVTCISGEGLAMICHLCCQDYGARHSGIPDLLVWRTSDSLCKFVEVKGPGDNLSENQKVWVDVLKQSGVGVEVCRVVEKGKENAATKQPRARKRKANTIILKDGMMRQNTSSAVIDVGSEEELEGPVSKGKAIDGKPVKRRRSEPVSSRLPVQIKIVIE